MYDVHHVVYGGTIGARVASHPTLEGAENAHVSDPQGVQLVILGPDPKNAFAKKVEVSRRYLPGKWIR